MFKPEIWHQAQPESPHGFPDRPTMLFQHVRALEEDQVDVHLMNLLNSRLYYNREPMMFQWDQDFVQHFRPLNANSENCIQSVLDTLVSRIGTQKSKATIYTRGADFDVYLKGRQLDKYLWGEFQGLDIHAKQRKWVLDAMVCGTGIMKIAVDWEADDIVAEITNPDEIIVDQRECASGGLPQTLFHRRLVSKLWVKEKFGTNKRVKAKIEEVKKNERYTSYRTPTPDQVVLIEAWKRPTLPGGDDGLHVISIDGLELFSEKWEEDDFPFVFLRWADAPGFYGRSLVSDLLGMQIRLNKLNEAIEWGQDVMCVPRVFIDQGTQVLDTRLDNQIGKVVRFRGTVPEAITWQAFHAEMYNERDRVRASMFEFAGVSQMSAQNKMPDQMRMDSSEAIREFGAHEDERFNDKAQSIEEGTLRIAQKILKCASELYTRNKDKTRKVTYRSGNLVEQIDWSEVDMAADKYVMQVAASSVLNLTPAARKDKLNFWFTNGLISPQKYMSLSGEPDLEHMSELQAAPTEHTEWQISQMLKGKPQVPDPNGDLVEAVITVNNTYLHVCTLENTPPRVKTVLQNWLLTAEHLMNQPAPQPEVMMPPGPPPPMPGAGGPPGAAPMDPAMGPAPLVGPNQPAMMPPQ